MKKTLLLSSIFLASVLVGCGKYQSQRQALVACNKWADKGERIHFIRYISRAEGDKDWYETDRTCELEEVTSQILGNQGTFDNSEREKEGTLIGYEDFPKPSNLKVVKNFRY